MKTVASILIFSFEKKQQYTLILIALHQKDISNKYYRRLHSCPRSYCIGARGLGSNSVHIRELESQLTLVDIFIDTCMQRDLKIENGILWRVRGWIYWFLAESRKLFPVFFTTWPWGQGRPRREDPFLRFFQLRIWGSPQ